MIIDTKDIKITAVTFTDDADGEVYVSLSDVRRSIESTPPVRVSGHWIEHEYAEECEGVLISNYECSICHSWLRDRRKFCGDCGSEMEVKS